MRRDKDKDETRATMKTTMRWAKTIRRTMRRATTKLESMLILLRLASEAQGQRESNRLMS